MKFEAKDFRAGEAAMKVFDVSDPSGLLAPLLNREIARQANARLAEMLEEAPRVYRQAELIGNRAWWEKSAKELGLDDPCTEYPLTGPITDTHTARLVCIEELKP